MATALAIYADSALTELVTSFEAIINAETPIALYVGSPDAGVTHERKTLPGTNQLTLSIVDNDTGDAVAVSGFKLATTEAGLASATPGASLDLGTSITSGAGNGVEVWVSYTDAAGSVASYTGAFSFSIPDVQDTPV